MTATLIALRQAEEPPTEKAPLPLPLHIASLVVHARPEQLNELKTWLLSQKGVEIHAENSLGKLVVVMETENQQQILDVIDSINQGTRGLNAALVYHEIISAKDIDDTTTLPASNSFSTEEHGA